MASVAPARRDGHSVLGARIFWRSLVSIAMVCGVLVIGQGLLATRLLQAERLDAVTASVDLLMPTLGNAAWDIDEHALSTVLQAVMAQPGVVAVRFADDAQQLQLPQPALQPGAQRWPRPAQPHAGSPRPVWPDCEHDIRRSLQGQRVGANTLTSGELRVCYVPSAGAPSADRLKLALLTGAPLVVVVVLASIFPAWLLRRMVIRPIMQIIESVRSDAGGRELTLVRPAGDEGDEIDQLVAELRRRTFRFEQERGVADSAFEALRDGMVITDMRQRVLRCNAAARLLLPEGERLTVGARWGEFVPAPVLRAFEHPYAFETPAGATLEASATRLMLGGQEGSCVYLLRDLTLKRQYEAAVQQSHKMNALGTLSSGVAHDFNNLLMAIGGNAELIGEQERLSEDGRQMLSAILTASERGSVLTSQLLSYARKQHLSPRVLDPREVVDEVVAMAARTLGGNHSVRVEGHSEWAIATDITFLETALLNLLVNARDAQVSGGVLRVRVGDQHTDGRDWVSLSVINRGPAIAPEVLGRMGEPFFTTKGSGRGTGLGLSMVMGFAQQSGGRMIMSSVTGETSMTIVLPAVAPDAGQADTRRRHKPSPLQQARVLLVDDDEVVLQVLSRMLQVIGHQVTAVASPIEVARLLAQGERWDVVLSDMLMEGHTGFDVHALMAEAGHAGPFFFVSGNIPPALGERLDSLPGIRMLQKPIELNVLREALETALGDSFGVSNWGDL
jgi:signal transduction histidine kinase